MLQIIKAGIFLAIILSMNIVSAQNYNNSPYTRYLVGDLLNSGFAYNRGLGGTSIALRPKNQVNYLNPASYTAQDTSSFIFHVGFTGRQANITTGIDADQSVNFNIDYLAIGFPVTKWWNVSAGATPFSRVQYFFREEHTTNANDDKKNVDYSGFGGFNEFYIGNSFMISNVVSLGVNASYLFGSLDQKQISYLPDLKYQSSSIENQTHNIASDFYFKFGFQAHPTIKDKHKIVAGLTYDTRSNIDVKLTGEVLRFNTAEEKLIRDTLHVYSDTSASFFLPNKLAVGLAYTYNDVFSVSGEYIKQDWTGTKIVGNNFKAGMYESYRFGVELIPVPIKNRIRVSYLKRINYRMGAYFTNTYLYTNTQNISDYGVSFGLGLPLKNARKIFTGTKINIGYQYGKRGITKNGLLQENYQILSFGLVLHDFWFLKPKYD